MTDRPAVPLAPSIGSLVSRRDMLRVGSLSIAAAALPAELEKQSWASPATATRRLKAKSVLFLWMAGVVPHIDSFDPKPNAPIEVRGTLDDIPTNVPGIRFCETLPQLSQMADQLAVVRNFSHDSDDHLLSQV